MEHDEEEEEEGEDRLLHDLDMYAQQAQIFATDLSLCIHQVKKKEKRTNRASNRASKQ